MSSGIACACCLAACAVGAMIGGTVIGATILRNSIENMEVGAGLEGALLKT